MKNLKTYALATLMAGNVAAKAQNTTLDGWLELSAGTPGKNLRLYPELNVGPVKINSLIDINNYFQFSKTDLSTSKAQVNAGPINIKPVITAYQDQFNGLRGMLGVNGSYFIPDKLFGFAELSINPLDAKGDSKFYTYNGLFLPNNKGRLGLFTATPTNSIKDTYVELEATGPSYRGIAPYGRINLQKGQKTTWQAGVSIKPKKVFNRHR